MEQLKLMLPAMEYAGQIAAYRRAFLESSDSMDGTGMLCDCDNPQDWIRKSEETRHEATVPAGWVPATQFICVRQADNRLVGMIQIRHRLNAYLEEFGGHIGYSVHPAERKKGYAKWMLGAALPHCRELGLEKVLITCNDDNPGSQRAILANGGIYESTVSHNDENLLRYWIAL